MRQQNQEEFDPDLDYEPDPGVPDGPEIDPAQVQHYVDLLRSRQHTSMAIMAGVAGAVLGALAELAITAAFDLQVGWMAIFAGILVGVMMRFFGHGIDLHISIAAVFLVALSIAAGDLLSGCALAAAQTKGSGFVNELTHLDPAKARAILKGTFNGIDIVFDASGLLAGFLLARRRVRVKAIMAMASAQQQRKAA